VRTTVERTVLDLLDGSTQPGGALALVADAVQRRLTTSARLSRALAESPRTRWRRTVLNILDDIAAGARSLLELGFLALTRAHGLPAGDRQGGRGSRREWLDVVTRPTACTSSWTAGSATTARGNAGGT